MEIKFSTNIPNMGTMTCRLTSGEGLGHTGEMSIEWTNSLQTNFTKLKRYPFQEPFNEPRLSLTKRWVTPMLEGDYPTAAKEFLKVIVEDNPTNGKITEFRVDSERGGSYIESVFSFPVAHLEISVLFSREKI